MDVSEQWELWLEGEAVQQILAGEDDKGYAANFLYNRGICPFCFHGLDQHGNCRNPECVCL